jgi:putative Ca2+/H+ antiporter (TMEM165/GDT1 family)
VNEEALNRILPHVPWLSTHDPEKESDIPTMDSFWKGFTSSTAMIIATEIGDKTFFIAAVLCMRNSRIAVFGGAILALIVMTIISTVMGFILPSILPRAYTHILGGLLFLYFGYKLLRDSRALQEYKVSDELEEVEEELLKTSGKKDEDTFVTATTTTSSLVGHNSGGGCECDHDGHHSHVQDLHLSEERRGNYHGDEESGVIKDSSTHVQRGTPSQVYKVFVQSFILTFLAEWGDRSQIATIALAASHNPYGVTIGACFGHGLCTGLAVMGGRMLASRISEKSVTFWGGWIFLGFGLHSLFLQD